MAIEWRILLCVLGSLIVFAVVMAFSACIVAGRDSRREEDDAPIWERTNRIFADTNRVTGEIVCIWVNDKLFLPAQATRDIIAAVPENTPAQAREVEEWMHGA